MRRRDVLAGAAAGAAALALGPHASAQTGAQGVREIGASFAPVKVSRDRIVRSVVGLRPFRETGFRLERVKVGRLDVVHNYGHGGGGVSLSWGCAEMAADLARETNRTDIAVLGAGVIGLTTALVLQRAGAQVSIHAEAFPPDTTSNIAAASWYPTTLYRRTMVGESFYGVLDHASRRAFRRFQHLANNPRYGVYWIRHHNLRNAAPTVQDHFPGGEGIFVGLRRNQEGHGPFGFTHWDAYYTLMIDPDIFLPALIDDFIAAGGKLVQQSFASVKDIEALKQRTIVNCTGLGARMLFNDTALIPARGQLSMLLPQPEIDYGYATSIDGGSIYMFPRKSAIVLGGSVGYDDWNTNVDEAEVTRMLDGHATMAGRAAM
jgi:glycine/D-amino acid oxidase-like deaminating enzyme